MFRKAVVGIVNFLFCHVFYRVKYINKEKIDNMGKCVVCANHSIMMEPAWLYCKTKNMWIMAKAELFKFKPVAKFFLYFNVFPIKRGQKDAKSIIHSINVLQQNENAKLLIFPEGTRIKKDKERGKAKAGPIYIAAKAGVPILPVYMTKNAKVFSSPRVIYGDPIDIPANVVEDKAEVQRYADLLLDKIYELKELDDSNKKKEKNKDKKKK